MAFNEKDFTGCKHNPLVKDILKSYPRLEELIANTTEFSRDDWGRLLKYIIATYDPASPLIKEYTVLPKRKQAAAILAGYNIHTEDKFLNEIYACTHEEFTRVVNSYLKDYGDSRLWAMIVSSLELFWEFNLRIITPIQEDRDKDLVAAVNMKSKMSEETEKIHERIERLTKQFYGDDQLQEETKKIRKTPESIAGI